MLVEDIEKTLAAQGVSREEVRFHVDQMVQNMAIYESNPGMYTIQSLHVFCVNNGIVFNKRYEIGDTWKDRCFCTIGSI